MTDALQVGKFTSYYALAGKKTNAVVCEGNHWMRVKPCPDCSNITATEMMEKMPTSAFVCTRCKNGWVIADD